jgi:hypothetical protein
MDGGEHKEETREGASTSCETRIPSFQRLYINLVEITSLSPYLPLPLPPYSKMETPYGKELKKTDAAKKAEAAKRKAANNAERAAKAAAAKKTTSNESSESTSDTEAKTKSKIVDRIPRKQVPRSAPAPATVPEVVDDEKTVKKLADENFKADDVVTITSSLLARLERLADSASHVGTPSSPVKVATFYEAPMASTLSTAPDTGRFRVTLQHRKIKPFPGQALSDGMSFQIWLGSHLRNVAGVSTNSDVMVGL